MALKRADADRVEKATIPIIRSNLITRNGKERLLADALERISGSKISEVSDRSKQKSHERDLVVSFVNGEARSIECRISGYGTTINSTLQKLYDSKALLSQGSYPQLLEDFKLNGRPQLLKNWANGNEEREGFVQEILSLPLSSMEDLLYNQRKQWPDLIRAVNALWYRLTFSRQEIVISEDIIRRLFEAKMMPPIVYLRQKEKLWLLKEACLNIKLIQETSKKKGGVALFNKDSKKKVGLLKPHWKNCIGVKTFAVNGWLPIVSAVTDFYSVMDLS